jgi:hypothetical protein
MEKRKRDRMKRHAWEELRVWAAALAAVTLFLWLAHG